MNFKAISVFFIASAFALTQVTSAQNFAALDSQMRQAIAASQSTDPQVYQMVPAPVVDSSSVLPKYAQVQTASAATRTPDTCYNFQHVTSISAQLQSTTNKLIATAGGYIRNTFNYGGFQGMVVCFAQAQMSSTGVSTDAQAVDQLARLPWVKNIDRDQIMHTQSYRNQENPPWSLDRLDQRNNGPAINGVYSFAYTGKGVNIYLLDTGVDGSHREFNHRAKTVYDATGENLNGDCAGHGTHVAGLAAGTNVGVAKLANIYSVRVLNCKGQGDVSRIIDAIQWTVRNHQKPAVINMSLGGGVSPALDEAVNAAIAAGIPVVVAAGNSNSNACGSSPARTPNAITVGATTEQDTQASFSNYGQCVDLYAPGVNILSSLMGGTSKYGVMSGTSMATPLVTGLVACLLERYPQATPSMISDMLKQNAVHNPLSHLSPGSPNLMARGELNGVARDTSAAEVPLDSPNAHIVPDSNNIPAMNGNSVGNNIPQATSVNYGNPQSSYNQASSVTYGSPQAIYNPASSVTYGGLQSNYY